MNTPQSKIDALKQEIINLTTKHWSTRARSLLLSQVGQTLARKGFDIRSDLRGVGLAAFVQSELADDITLLTSPNDPLVKGLIPANVAATGDLSAFFPERTTQSPTKSFRFDRALWTAFSRPIATGQMRAISFKPRVQFRDVPLNSAPYPGEFRIDESLLVVDGDKTSDQRVAEISSNIRRWFGAIGQDIELGRASSLDSRDASRFGDSLLADLIFALDGSERERLNLPLDVVAKLLSSKGRRG